MRHIKIIERGLMAMKISKEEIREVVRRVLTYYIRRKEYSGNEERSLFLIPLYPVSLNEVLLEYELYGGLEKVDFVLEDHGLMIPELKDRRVFCAENREDIGKIFQSLTQYERLEIYSPSLNFLRAVKEGKEENVLIRITLCFLLMKRPVTVRLPYRAEELPEGRFGKEVRDMQADLWDMGISFGGLHSGIGVIQKEAMEDRLELVTEEVVEEAYAGGCRELTLSRSAVITPLGMERAKELGIHMTKR